MLLSSMPNKNINWNRFQNINISDWSVFVPDRPLNKAFSPGWVYHWFCNVSVCSCSTDREGGRWEAFQVFPSLRVYVLSPIFSCMVRGLLYLLWPFMTCRGFQTCTLSPLWRDGRTCTSSGVGVGFHLLLLDTDCGKCPSLRVVQNRGRGQHN